MTRGPNPATGPGAPVGESGPGDARWSSAWPILVVGMLASAGLALWFGREISFTIDEYSWISLSARFGPGEALAPYVGHLIAVPRLIYWLTLEAFGSGDYRVFQILALISLFIMIGLLFTWLRRRTGDAVALPFCLVLLVFPVDHLHYLTGNGITISLALAFGISALLAWEREDRSGDIGALVLLLLGAMTYTIAIPFAIGLVVAAMISRGSRSRFWVGAIPLLLYGLWRVLEGAGGIRSETGSIEWDNLLLLPAWSFQSVGSILAAMTGLGFDFTNVLGGPAFEQGAVVGPALVTLALLGLAWRLRLGPPASGFWVALAILGALLASQVIVWGTLEGRTPGAPRYLLPGAVLVVLVVGEALGGTRPGRVVTAALWAVAAAGVSISIGIMATGLGWLETTERGARAEITAVEILEDSEGRQLPPGRQPRENIRSEYDARDAGSYGYLGFTTEELDREEGWVGARIDRFLAETLSIRLTTPEPGYEPNGCRPAEPTPGFRPPRVEVSSPGVVIEASKPVSLALGRYGEWAPVRLGVVSPGRPKELALPGDEGIPPGTGGQEWFIQTRTSQPGAVNDIVLCDPGSRKERVRQ